MNNQLIPVVVDTLKWNVCAFLFENNSVRHKVSYFEVFLIHKTNMELPQRAIYRIVMFDKNKLRLLDRLIWQFAESKLCFKENSKTVGLPFWIVANVNLSKLTRSFELNYGGFHLNDCLNSCVSTPLVKFGFGHCEHENCFSFARLTNYPQI